MKKLTKLLVMALAAVMLLPSAVLADEPQQPKELWMQWIRDEWTDEGVNYELDGEPHYESPALIPNEEHHLAFFTCEDAVPVPVEKLEASEGLIIHPLCPGEKGKENFAKIYFTEWDKEYTVSYDGCSMIIESRLPDLALYSAAEATTGNFLKDWDGLGYSPVRDNRTAYIISTAQDDTHGRHLVDLAVSEDCKDKDSFTLEKVSGGVYKWTLKAGDINVPEVHLPLKVTWQNAKFVGGETYTEDREFVACQQASLLVSDKPVERFDRENPTVYNDVKAGYPNKLTLKVGEAKDIYVAFTNFDEEHNAWVMRNTSALLLMASNSSLKVTSDISEPAKATVSCDVPGTYTLTIDTRSAVIDALYHENGEQYTMAEFQKWDEEHIYYPQDGKLMVYTDLETGASAPFEEVFPGEKADYHIVLDDVWYPVTVTVGSGTFPDVDGSKWYAPAVQYVSAKGYMTGDSNGKFNPDNKITGAEFAQILYNKEGRPAAAQGASFQGVKDQWYAPAILWAAGEGIITDTGDAAVDPEKPLAREQIALMLYNDAGKPEGSADLSAFTDADQISAWAKDAMEWAVSAKVFQGGDGKLNPTGTATRAEVAQILMNYFG